ncbi:MAG: GPO family capsid scaffolding protein [Methylobacter sp.]
MADRVLKTDFKRIGRSGPTVDGRVVEPQWINEMAASYDKSLFTALIWPEHQRYVNYGAIEELRSTDNEEGGRDLWAVLSPNSFYTGSNQYGQKLFTSMEITPDFRKTGKAYLTGLGATDDPASAATSEIRLSKVADQGGIILTKAVETIDKTFEDPAPNTLLDQIKALFKNQPHEEEDMADKEALANLQTEFAEVKNLLVQFTQQQPGKQPDDKQDDKAPAVTPEQFTALTNRIAELETKFSQKPADDKPTVTPADLKQLTDKFNAMETRLNDALKEQPGTDSGQHYGANDPDAQHIV